MTYNSSRRTTASAPPYQDDAYLRQACQELLAKIDSLYSYPNPPQPPAVQKFVVDVKTICAIANSEHAQARSSGGYEAALQGLTMLLQDISENLSPSRIEDRIPHYSQRLNNRLHRFLLDDMSISDARERLGLVVDEIITPEDSDDVGSTPQHRMSHSPTVEDEDTNTEDAFTHGARSGEDTGAGQTAPPNYHPMDVRRTRTGGTVVRSTADLTVRPGESLSMHVGPYVRSRRSRASAHSQATQSTSLPFRDFSVHIDERNNTYISEGGHIRVHYGAVIYCD